MIVLNSLFPIFTLLVLGRILKLRGLTDEGFLRSADKLIYFFFFPVMLFWKIGGASFDNGIDWTFCAACLTTMLIMFFLSSVVIKLFGISNFKAGSFSQSCYRFNTYIGVAVILNSLGSEGLKYFGIVIGFTIPVVNLFAVSIMIWFSEQNIELSKRVVITLKAIFSNPLILACLAGVSYGYVGGGFPVFIDNSFSLISMVALPLALLSIGGSLTFAGVKEHLGLSLLAALLKLCILPLIGYLLFTLLGVADLPAKVGMIFFALPASTAIYVLSSQMHSDTNLASSAIVISTVLSVIPLSIVLLM